VTPNGAALPRWFIVVRRDKPVLYQHLRESYDGDGRVEVILDRRRAVLTEMPPEADARERERRGHNRRAATESDRRQAQRRRPLAKPQHEFWARDGFFMTRRAV
jgi:hypothetical protein